MIATAKVNGSELIVGDLELKFISYLPALGPEPAAVLVECAVDSRPMRLRLDPAALDNFASFRKSCLKLHGVMPRSLYLDELPSRDRARAWDEMVADAADPVEDGR